MNEMKFETLPNVMETEIQEIQSYKNPQIVEIISIYELCSYMNKHNEVIELIIKMFEEEGKKQTVKVALTGGFTRDEWSFSFEDSNFEDNILPKLIEEFNRLEVIKNIAVEDAEDGIRKNNMLETISGNKMLIIGISKAFSEKLEKMFKD